MNLHDSVLAVSRSLRACRPVCMYGCCCSTHQPRMATSRRSSYPDGRMMCALGRSVIIWLGRVAARDGRRRASAVCNLLRTAVVGACGSRSMRICGRTDIRQWSLLSAVSTGSEYLTAACICGLAIVTLRRQYGVVPVSCFHVEKSRRPRTRGRCSDSIERERCERRRY
ncbi:hypothetical protein DENSPDRAFT_134191 [Dentipellis sp. KUC8613]|nr:hypothetical protein DENSPDRAFT_134191 [Dentipellis sp. KUC8613]